MTLEDTIRDHITALAAQAKQARMQVQRVGEEAGDQLNAHAQRVVDTAQARAMDIESRAVLLREEFEHALNLPQTAAEIQRDAGIITAWVLDHVERLSAAGVAVQLPIEVQEAMSRFQASAQ